MENSREEDIEGLKRLLYRNELSQYGKRKLINYYEQQEKDYKRVLKENELLRKDIEGWKKYCEEIEEEQTEISNKNCKLEFEIEKLQKENEDLHREINQRIKLKIENEKIVDTQFISVQKVKDKIEELKQEKKKYGNCLIEMYEDELVNRDIKILQELLESEE